jgi:epoxide hydrolase
MPIDVQPYRVHVPESDLIELRGRLARARWPEASPTPGWTQGMPLELVQDLCRYWAEEYEWRSAEARLNAVPQYLVSVQGLAVHVLHARSPHPNALPLVLTHGWPGSVLELVDLVEPLTDPVRHGGAPEDAFDVVIPSLPGYGFSAKPTTAGWGIERIASAWAELMAGLGYTSYGAAGSDWGTSVSSCLAAMDPEHVAGIHLVPPLAGPDPADAGDRTEAEGAALAQLQERGRLSSAYSDIHRTAPQTLGYALVDSPTGLCAWMGEKLQAWPKASTRFRHGSAAPAPIRCPYPSVRPSSPPRCQDPPDAGPPAATRTSVTGSNTNAAATSRLSRSPNS